MRTATPLAFFASCIVFPLLVHAGIQFPSSGQIPLLSPFNSDEISPVPRWMSLPVANPTKSFWINTPHANPLAREGSSGPLGFGDDKEVDVCVIGSGITGISSAYHLRRLLESKDGVDVKRRVVVLEAREFCSGATGRNGGHLTRNPFRDYIVRAGMYGQEDAKKSYLVEDYTASAIVDIIRSHRIERPVDLVADGHISLFFDEEEEKLAKLDYESARAAGIDLRDVRLIDKEEMLQTYGVPHPGVFFPSYNLWPLKLVSALYNISSAPSTTFDVKLHTLTPVLSITPSKRSDHHHLWNLTTPRGDLVCKHVVHATNAYASYLLPHLQDKIVPTRGQVIAVQANTSLDRLKRHSWTANWGNEYWFPRPEEGEERGYKAPLVILGGGRDVAGPDMEQYIVDDSVINEVVSKTLRRFLPALFNGTGLFAEGKEPEMEWTGIMGFTPTGAPFVGPLSDRPGQYIAAGFTGHGMPRTFAAAEAVAGMIVAELTGTKWEKPEWLPDHYLTVTHRA